MDKILECLVAATRRSQTSFYRNTSKVLDAVGIVHATYEINYTMDGIESNYYGRRSTVFQWDNDRWHAIHLHVSNHLRIWLPVKLAGESFKGPK
jgi:hypothetical protein